MGEVLDMLPMAQGWALIAWDRENDPWLNIEKVGLGYIAQDIEKSMKGK